MGEETEPSGSLAISAYKTDLAFAQFVQVHQLLDDKTGVAKHLIEIVCDFIVWFLADRSDSDQALRQIYDIKLHLGFAIS